MKIAIVILNWNGELLLQKYLPSVVKHSPGADIYVADNASSDDSVAVVRQLFPSVGIIQNTENGGFAKGYNDALAHVDADVYCLLNSDVEVTEDWLVPVSGCLWERAECSSGQHKIMERWKPYYFEYAGAAGGGLDQVGYPGGRGRIWQILERDRGQYDDIREIFWATG
ncbi:MAG: glycosyltransferase family 2 protein, partial [Flavobacteriaceae bacterium]